MTLRHAASIADLRLMARRRLPRPVFDYIDGGADDERTLRRNSEAFGEYQFLPSVLTDISTLHTGTRLFGRDLAWPLMLSPTGLNRMFHDDAEAAVVRAATRHGVAFGLSTIATTRLEDIAPTLPRLFQLYVFRDRGLTVELVERCRAAGYDGLLLTVDTPLAGNRERDVRNGLSLPPRLSLASALSFAAHPRWSLGALTGARFDFANVSPRVDALAERPMSLTEYINSQFDRTLTWTDFEWLAGLWGGPIAVKGLITPEDARRAVASGATAVMVSNHGGRQLDGAPAPVEQLTVIREAVGPSIEVICDGGVRRGADVVKALALGATACSIGRPYLWGLAAAGEAGVDHALTLLKQGFDRTLALLGVTDVAELGPQHVRRISPL